MIPPATRWQAFTHEKRLMGTSQLNVPFEALHVVEMAVATM
jgi:hypothetical protein